MRRAEGYYWVRLHDSDPAEIAFWNPEGWHEGGGWQTIDSDIEREDEGVEVIFGPLEIPK